MEQFNDIWKISREFEKVLDRKFGAQGKGLHSKLSSVQRELPKELVLRIRKIADIRNKTMHERDIEFSDFKAFKQEAKKAYLALRSYSSAPNATPDIKKKDGIIHAYMAEKKYGFIHGDDGQSYFFHYRDLLNCLSDNSLEGHPVHFEAILTQKGYRAKNCTVLAKETVNTYRMPDDFLFSKSNKFKSWEIIDAGAWEVHGSSQESPDSAKQLLKDHARRIGANAARNLNYYKTTGTEGNYRFTIHNFKAQAVRVGRRDRAAHAQPDDFPAINVLAQTLLKEHKAHRRKKRAIKLSVFFAGIALLLPSLLNGYLFILPVILILASVFIPMPKLDWLNELSEQGNHSLNPDLGWNAPSSILSSDTDTTVHPGQSRAVSHLTSHRVTDPISNMTDFHLGTQGILTGSPTNVQGYMLHQAFED
ncbi:hypothetical protein GCM10011332_08980 [Terasakiella brassicae]|uniref:CSD domain-containing protein n=1 Tax=Terasakiella brassicae TaxID=1634917 RepID=A0A917BVX8_9PROT|nr:cold shock domain-containing protein [Terasakiella brassicae]GGF57703.1 hypothetical protein GCM10011332_08980 [Terasakiella brassicae]